MQRLLRGESLEKVSREMNVPVHRLSEWRDRALLAVEGALKECERNARDEEIERLNPKVGEITRSAATVRSRYTLSSAFTVEQWQ